MCYFWIPPSWFDAVNRLETDSQGLIQTGISSANEWGFGKWMKPENETGFGLGLTNVIGYYSSYILHSVGVLHVGLIFVSFGLFYVSCYFALPVRPIVLHFARINFIFVINFLFFFYFNYFDVFGVIFVMYSRPMCFYLYCCIFLCFIGDYSSQ